MMKIRSDKAQLFLKFHEFPLENMVDYTETFSKDGSISELCTMHVHCQ